MINSKEGKMRELIQDMQAKDWIIDSFLFIYNKKACVVTIQLYQDDDMKPNNFARAKVTFRKQDDMSQTLKAYANYSKISFFNAIDFYNFFDIKRSGSNIPAQQVFNDFSSYFMKCVPTHKTIRKDNVLEEQAILAELDKKQAKGRYCYSIKRNTEGEYRRLVNSNKAEMLRYELYQEYKDDPSLSFCFSEDPNKEKTDDEIRFNFANRNDY